MQLITFFMEWMNFFSSCERRLQWTIPLTDHPESPNWSWNVAVNQSFGFRVSVCFCTAAVFIFSIQSHVVNICLCLCWIICWISGLWVECLQFYLRYLFLHFGPGACWNMIWFPGNFQWCSMDQLSLSLLSHSLLPHGYHGDTWAAVQTTSSENSHTISFHWWLGRSLFSDDRQEERVKESFTCWCEFNPPSLCSAVRVTKMVCFKGELEEAVMTLTPDKCSVFLNKLCTNSYFHYWIICRLFSVFGQ